MQSARRANVVALVLVAIYTVLGFYEYHHPGNLTWLPRAALTLAVIAPIAWIMIYTVQGWLGHGKWWRTDLGTNLVWMQIAVLCSDGLVGYSQWFSHGLLDTFTEAWIYIGGVLASIIVITWRSVIWLRNYRFDPRAEVRELQAQVAERDAQILRLRRMAGLDD